MFSIDDIAPRHCRTSCQDFDPCNAYVSEMGNPRCTRCLLLTLDSEELLADYSISISVTKKLSEEEIREREELARLKKKYE